jgi:hypothetical protein
MRWHRLAIEDHDLLRRNPQATRQSADARHYSDVNPEHAEPRNRIRKSAVAGRHDDTCEPIRDVFVRDHIDKR